MDEANWLASTDPAAMLAYLSVGCPGVRHRLATDRKLRLWVCGCCRLCWPLLADPRSRAAVEIAERFADGLATEDEMNRAFETALHAEPTATRDDAVVTTLLAIPHLRWLDGEFLGRLHRLGVPPAAQAGLLRCVVGDPSRPVTLPKGPRCLLCMGMGQIDRPIICGPNTSDEDMRRIADEAGGPIPCPSCRRTGHQPCPWLTPTVFALAAAAYAEPRRVKCGRCGGRGSYHSTVTRDSRNDHPCPDCSGTGTTTDGLLDNDNLARLSDALEDCGCEDAALLAHLRDPGPHARGCHVVDLLLDKE